MTKILLSALVTDMRNSTAGTTFSKNRYGNVMKKKQTPILHRSDAQSQWRNTQSGIARAWRGLTDIERQTWIDGSDGFPYTDKFGVVRTLSGFSLYQQINLNLSAIHQTGLTSCPTPISVPALPDAVLDIVYNSDDLIYIINLENVGIPSTGNPYIVCYASQPGSQGRMAGSLTQYFIGTWHGTGTTADFSDAFKATFGIPALTTKSFFSFCVILADTGQRGVVRTFSYIFNG